MRVMRHIQKGVRDAMDDQDIVIYTFSYKRGQCPRHVPSECIVDCRGLPNPWKERALRELPGTDPRIFRYLLKHDPKGVNRRLKRMTRLCREGKALYVGCYGGRHRSVAMAHALERNLKRLHPTWRFTVSSVGCK